MHQTVAFTDRSGPESHLRSQLICIMIFSKSGCIMALCVQAIGQAGTCLPRQVQYLTTGNTVGFRTGTRSVATTYEMLHLLHYLLQPVHIHLYSLLLVLDRATNDFAASDHPCIACMRCILGQDAS
jgi:hypothetical protein